MVIKLYALSKKHNSTKEPTDSNLIANLTGTIINDGNTSLLNPQIKLTISSDQIIHANYCGLPAFGRYYYIDDWIYNGDGTWTAKCTVDELASWKQAILESSGYVGRANKVGERNTWLSDTLYPPTEKFLHFADTCNTGLGTDPDSGTFILGILHKPYDTNNALISNIQYYAFPRSVLVQLMRAIFDATGLNNFDDLTKPDSAYYRALANPMQYIVSAKWFPIPFNYMFPSSSDYYTSTGFIYLGSWRFTFTGTIYLLKKTDAYFPTGTPQALGIGEIPIHNFRYFTNGQSSIDTNLYPQYPPFVKYVLYTYFGAFELDSNMMFNAFRTYTTQSNNTALYWRIDFDIITGFGTFQLKMPPGANYENDNTILRKEIKFAVDIPIASESIDYVGAFDNLHGAAGTGISAIANVASFDFIGGFSNLLNAFQQTDRINQNMNSPIVQSSTNNIAGFTQLITTFTVEQRHYRIVEPTPQIAGYLIKAYYPQIGVFAGTEAQSPFIQMDKSQFNYICTDKEQDNIIQQLESGCYLE